MQRPTLQSVCEPMFPCGSLLSHHGGSGTSAEAASLSYETVKTVILKVLKEGVKQRQNITISGPPIMSPSEAVLWLLTSIQIATLLRQPIYRIREYLVQLVQDNEVQDIEIYPLWQRVRSGSDAPANDENRSPPGSSSFDTECCVFSNGPRLQRWSYDLLSHSELLEMSSGEPVSIWGVTVDPNFRFTETSLRGKNGAMRDPSKRMDIWNLLAQTSLDGAALIDSNSSMSPDRLPVWKDFVSDLPSPDPLCKQRRTTNHPMPTEQSKENEKTKQNTKSIKPLPLIVAPIKSKSKLPNATKQQTTAEARCSTNQTECKPVTSAFFKIASPAPQSTAKTSSIPPVKPVVITDEVSVQPPVAPNTPYQPTGPNASSNDAVVKTASEDLFSPEPSDTMRGLKRSAEVMTPAEPPEVKNALDNTPDSNRLPSHSTKKAKRLDGNNRTPRGERDTSTVSPLPNGDTCVPWNPSEGLSNRSVIVKPAEGLRTRPRGKGRISCGTEIPSSITQQPSSSSRAAADHRTASLSEKPTDNKASGSDTKPVPGAKGGLFNFFSVKKKK